ncbi:TM2 domain-containing protein [Paraclostridium sordellii]|uniref:TM2 domain-containing protein n=1 Tax=Paraclostridium sordellii TaxID=1505 RepID=UPI0021BA8FEF|nr:TM2 domain-containing protein [Paeniclostridium sordellii]
MKDTFKSYNRKGNNKKVLSGVLAIFLCGMEIHRFYLGYKETGFIQLSLFLVGYLLFWPASLVSSIWALIDAIKIFTGRMCNASGEYLIYI